MITITFHGKQYQVPKFCSINEFLDKYAPELMTSVVYQDNPIIAGLANNEMLPLSAKLNHSFELEEVHLFSEFGRRIYRNSICFLLSYASHILFPQRHLVICHSLGDGFYFTFEDQYVTTERTISEISRKMKELVSQRLPLDRMFVPYETAKKYFSEHGYDDTVELLDYINSPDIECYGIGDYYEVSMEVLTPSTASLGLWELKPYSSNGMLLRYPRSSSLTEIKPFVDNPLLFKVFTEYKKWGRILGVQTVGRLDKICYDEKQIKEYIRLSESLQARKIANIADDIDSKLVKIVLIAGPSSSGKTTFANKLCIQLKMLGHDAIRISLDDYYLHPSQAPKDSDGKPDLEALEALDVPLFVQNLSDLLDGKPVDLPHFKFKTATRYYRGTPVTITGESILVVEGIHGLNPKLLTGFNNDTIYRIYISALTQINLDDHTRLSTTDNRLLRRLVRDYNTRNTSALTTLKMWTSVHKGSKTHIFPYQNNADAILNSALDYEVSALSRFAVPLLKTIKPSNEQCYTTARRLLKILDYVHPIQSTLVPQDSLLREFIGGSEFEG